MHAENICLWKSLHAMSAKHDAGIECLAAKVKEKWNLVEMLNK